MPNPIRIHKMEPHTTTQECFNYRDPALVLERKQDLAMGCLGCAMRLINKKQHPHKAYCNAAQPIFPRGDKQSCKWWRAKGKK